MTWKPTDHVDEQVRGWMRARRWEVTATDYHFDQEIYSWRHQQPGGKSPTLRIARNVLEHNPAFVILYHLDRLNVARALLANPDARLVVVQEGTLRTAGSTTHCTSQGGPGVRASTWPSTARAGVPRPFSFLRPPVIQPGIHL